MQPKNYKAYIYHNGSYIQVKPCIMTPNEAILASNDGSFLTDQNDKILSILLNGDFIFKSFKGGIF